MLQWLAPRQGSRQDLFSFSLEFHPDELCLTTPKFTSLPCMLLAACLLPLLSQPTTIFNDSFLAPKTTSFPCSSRLASSPFTADPDLKCLLPPSPFLAPKTTIHCCSLLASSLFTAELSHQCLLLPFPFLPFRCPKQLANVCNKFLVV